MKEAAISSDDASQEVMPYIWLWRHVMRTAITDIKAKGKNSDPHGAAAYFFSGDCDDRIGYAGFDAEWLRHKILMKATKGDGGWRRARKNIEKYLRAGKVASDSKKQCHAFLAFLDQETAMEAGQ